MKRLSSIFSLSLILLVISCGGGETAGIIYFDSAKTKKWKETIQLEGGIQQVIHYYESGKKRKEVHFSGPKLHGKYGTWYESGQVEAEKEYKDGFKEGLHKAYYDNGQLSSSKGFKDGRLEGESKYYYIDGKLWLEEVYSKGDLSSHKRH